MHRNHTLTSKTSLREAISKKSLAFSNQKHVLNKNVLYISWLMETVAVLPVLIEQTKLVLKYAW